MKLTKQKNYGYTLFELLVVISIISVLMFIGLSKFDRDTRVQKVNSAVRQAGFAIQQARHYARIKGVRTQLVFNSGNNKYVIKTSEEILTDNPKFDSTLGILPKGTKIIGSTCVNVYFHVDGEPVDFSGDSLPNDCTITIGYGSSEKKALTLKVISGNVEYEK